MNLSQHPNIRLSQENIFVPHVQALRAGATVDLDQPPWFAVTTFPSLHSTMAVVFAWALRTVAYVRWAGLLANAMMLTFTPLHGSHYFIDVIAGVALALVAIPASQWLMRTLAGPSARAAIASRLARAPGLK
jgi:membrane-associated phospholipid phosphatase